MLKLAIVGMISLLLSTTTSIEEPKAPSHHSLSTATYEKLPAPVRAQVDCLANNIYFEANNQSEKGQIAVGLVTMNRVNSKEFPKSVCGVVKQQKAHTCQFSWWCNSKLKAKAIANRFRGAEKEVFEEIRNLATWIFLYHHKIEDVTNGATFYHATYVKPNWRNVEKTVRIEDHIFYRGQ